MKTIKELEDKIKKLESENKALVSAGLDWSRRCDYWETRAKFAETKLTAREQYET